VEGGLVLADLLTGMPDAAELEALDPAGLAAEFHRLDHERRLAEARLVALIEVVDRTGAHHLDGQVTAAGWLRALGRWSAAEARQRVRSARMASQIDAVATSLASGALGVAQCHELARAHANPRCGDLLHPVMDTLLDAAGTLPFDEFRTVVHRWETLADTDGAHRDAAASHDRRTASVHLDDDGMHLHATGSTLSGAIMANVLRRFCDAEFASDWEATRAMWGDQATASMLPRTDSQRRFDALEAIFQRAAANLPGSRPAEPLVNIVVDLETLDRVIEESSPSGLRRHATRSDATDPRRRRCETTDGTPLTPADVLVAALAGQVRRVVVDGAGVVLDMGRRRRLFTGAARDAVLLGAQHCVWPGCVIPAGRCQADHLTAWCDDGTTHVANGAPLCGRHNRFKATGYTVWRDEQGSWHTRRPDGSLIC
jgi:hypothetical protein